MRKINYRESEFDAPLRTLNKSEMRYECDVAPGLIHSYCIKLIRRHSRRHWPQGSIHTAVIICYWVMANYNGQPLQADRLMMSSQYAWRRLCYYGW